MGKSLDLIGQKINKLTVISKEPSRNNNRRSRFKCECECGNITIVDGPKLNSGIVISCGCMIGKQPKPQLRKEGTLENIVIASYKHNAKKRNLEFSLSNSDMKIFFSQNCFYCGRAPSRTISKKRFYGTFTYNGIDRMDSEKGYIKENCVSCCSTCNFLKKSHHINEFLKLVRAIYNNTINFEIP
jgi:hypothetical protein